MDEKARPVERRGFVLSKQRKSIKRATKRERTHNAVEVAGEKGAEARVSERHGLIVHLEASESDGVLDEVS